MCRKVIYFVSFILVLNMAGNAKADLILHWRFDEGSGTTAYDSSGNGRDGTLVGDPKWVAGKIDGALEFGGDGDHVLDDDAENYLNGLDSLTVCMWIKSNLTNTDKGFLHGVDPVGQDRVFAMRYDQAGASFGGSNLLKMGVASTGNNQNLESSSDLQTTEWQHVAMTWTTGALINFFVNGVEDTPAGRNRTNNTGPVSEVTKLIVGKGGKDQSDTDGWDGLIDDVRIYDEVLTVPKIQAAMKGEAYPYALGPEPADGTLVEDTWANLSWSPGELAISHDVYIGDNFDDVNNGAEGTFQGNQTGTFLVVGFPGFAFPDGLVPGATYYWRIDEVNDAEPNSPWKGDVWSFSVPPKTAYYPDPADGAESVDPDTDLSWTPGFGAKLHTVYFGDNFDDVNNAAGGLPQGTATYTPTGPLKLAKTYYWRVDESDAIETYKGDVWSFTTQGAVGNPNPANGAVDVKQTQIITWSPSVFAASHQLYFGTDKDAVKNADTGSPAYKGTRDLGAETYDPGMLEWDATYYWRIDEVNNANPDSPWPGILWSFTTANFLVVDDFESYNDIDPPDPESNRIFEAWPDGYEIPTNGALVGNDAPPYAEQDIVHSGIQSMPYVYDNSVGNSEATHTLTYPRDWTEKGVNRLTICFIGDAANAAETLYVVLNGSAVVNHENPNAAQIDKWTEWIIPLQAFADQGVNLANVNTIGLGLGDRNNPIAGGSGTMYFDDIWLYPPAP